MTTILVIPGAQGDVSFHRIRDNRFAEVEELLSVYGVRLPSATAEVGPDLELSWDPDLSASDQLMAQRAIRLSGLMRITPAEWEAIEGDLAVGRAFLQNPSPSNAEAVAGLKAVMRVIRAMLRD